MKPAFDGLAASVGHVWYGASKAGLANASETLRVELAPHNVHVVVVYPGPITTPMAEAAFAKMGGREKLGKVPEGSPEELARLVRSAVEHRAARVIYPRSYSIGYLAPWFFRWIKTRKGLAPAH